MARDPRRWSQATRALAIALLASAIAGLAACAMNPATGQSQLSFFGYKQNSPD